MHDKQENQSREDMLLQKYRDVGKMPGIELMLHQPDAMHFIEDCKALGLVILGMDFYVEENGRRREVNSTAWGNIKDEPGALELSVEEAYKLIRDGLPDEAEWVSFVVEEQSTAKYVSYSGMLNTIWIAFVLVSRHAVLGRGRHVSE
jgi:hypothetical protein